MPTITLHSTRCARCSGSGRYSWNAAEGDRCRACRGSGRVLTQAGKRTKAFLEDRLAVLARNVRPGDVLVYERVAYRVSAVEADQLNPGQLLFSATRCSDGRLLRFGAWEAAKLRRAPTQADIDAAFAFQSYRLACSRVPRQEVSR